MAGENDLVFRAVGADEAAAGIEKVNVALDVERKRLSEIKAENAALDRAAKQLKSTQETAAQQYNRLLEQTHKLLETVRVDEQEHAAEVANLKKEYDTLTGRFEKYGAAQRKAEEQATAAREKAVANRRHLQAMQDADLAKSLKDRESAELSALKRLEQAEMAKIQKEKADLQQLATVAEGIIKRQETAEQRHIKLIEQATAARKANMLTEQQYTAEVERLNQVLAETTTQAEDVGESTEKSFGEAALGKLAGVAAGYVSIQAALQLITAEMKAQQKLRDDQANAVMTVAESRNVVRRNMPGSSDAEMSSVLKQNEDLARELNVSETVINQARANALSASGGDVAASFEAVRTSARFLHDKPGDIALTAGTLLDLARVTGSKDSEQNLGLLSAVSGISRVVDTQKAAQTIPGALIGARSFGATTSEAAALFAAITTGSGDFEGSSSRTATIKAAQKLSEFGTGEDATDEQRGLKTITDKIRYLQRNFLEAEKFLDSSGIESQSLGAMRGLLLDPSSYVATDFTEFLGKIPDGAGLKDKGFAMLGSMHSDPLDVQVQEERSAKAMEERLDIARRSKLASTQTLATASKILTATGDSQTAANFNLEGFVDGASRNDVIDTLERRRRALEIGKVKMGDIDTPEERAGMISEIDELLKQLIKVNEMQLAEQQKMNATRQPGNQVGMGNGILGGNE